MLFFLFATPVTVAGISGAPFFQRHRDFIEGGGVIFLYRPPPPQQSLLVKFVFGNFPHPKKEGTGGEIVLDRFIVVTITIVSEAVTSVVRKSSSPSGPEAGDYLIYIPTEPD